MKPIDINEIIKIAIQAGDIILSFYHKNDIQVKKKEDNSPVTNADVKSSEFICAALEKKFPHISVVSEEQIPESINDEELFWLIDPLDGTKGFISQNDEFSVNIALINKDNPILGVIYIPVTGEIFYASDTLKGSYKRSQQDKEAIKLNPRNISSSDLTLAINRSFKIPEPQSSDRFTFSPIRLNAAGKFGLVAEGKADVYFRKSPTYEWDTAAGHCIVNWAGGCLLDWEGQPFKYGKKTYLNSSFIVLGDKHLDYRPILNQLRQD